MGRILGEPCLLKSWEYHWEFPSDKWGKITLIQVQSGLVAQWIERLRPKNQLLRLLNLCTGRNMKQNQAQIKFNIIYSQCNPGNDSLVIPAITEVGS